MPKSSKKSKKLPEPVFQSPKEEKLYQNLLRTTQQFMSGKNYKPLTLPQLMKRLSLPPQHTELFNHILATLQDQGLIEMVHNTYIWKQNKANVVTGVLSVHPRGFAFLRPDDPLENPEDIFIPRHLTLNAVDGDTVEVVINSEVVSEKGPEGKVVTVLARGRTHIAGIIVEAQGTIIAHVPLLGTQHKVIVQTTPDHPLRVGDRIVMEVQEWGEKGTETLCRLSHYIGHISDPSCDIKAAVEEYELRTEFPQRALDEALKLGTKVSPKDLIGREDLRSIECFTIDPDTAKDYDDALSLSKEKDGTYHLGVHIADVSHYVQAGSALDKEAKLRCNSTYFPGECIPMLPPELSNNLCSLKANVNRLTLTVLMKFDKEGSMLSYQIVRAVIKSAKRFTYREAKEVLDGKKKSKHAPTLRLMVELCGLLKKKRYERGSIEFAMTDLMVIVDEGGVPQKMDRVEYDITHQLVEEFMLKANETVATHLSNMGKDLSYRIHEEPAEENMRDFAMLARAFGFQLSDPPKVMELQTMFEEAMKTPYGQYLASSYIRRMRLAIYSPENIGHYGLGLTHYCHFTSPIRRYIDLVIHRLVCGEGEEREKLEMISTECSEQERISAKSEQSVVLLKKQRLLKGIQEKDPRRQYEAVVTRVKPFGIFFEVLEFMLESFLHVSELESDYFNYDEKTAKLIGARHGMSYHSGDKITVLLKDVNFITQENQWHLVSKERSTIRKPPEKEKKKFSRPPPPSPKTKTTPKAETPKKSGKRLPVKASKVIVKKKKQTAPQKTKKTVKKTMVIKQKKSHK